MASPSAELVVQGVSAVFGGVHALNEVHVRVQQGTILGLIGPNGAGKTTLVNIITGFLAPSEGRVVLADQDITSWPPHRRARAGLARTFQGVRLFEGLSLYENVRSGVSAIGRAPRGIHVRVGEALRLVGLGDHTDRLAGSLSYGDQRRLALARALATDPIFLLLDEPAAGLNDRESADLSELLLKLRSEYNLSLVVIEHDLRLIMTICDCIHVLDQGMTIAEGPPNDVTSSKRVREAYLGKGYE